jgi:hypothetical protein
MTSVKCWISGAVVMVHTLLVFICGGMVWSSNDGEAGFAWFLFITIDWPISHIIFDYGAPDLGTAFVLRLLVLGALQWVIVVMAFCWMVSLISARLPASEEKK